MGPKELHPCKTNFIQNELTQASSAEVRKKLVFLCCLFATLFLNWMVKLVAYQASIYHTLCWIAYFGGILYEIGFKTNGDFA